ncbi:MAG: glycosyltransferase family 4 protein [Patescibacteria group bacterium]
MLSLQCLQDRAIRVYLWFGLFLIWLAVGLVLNFRSLLPAEVPLFYSQPWGSSRLVFKNFLFVLPCISAFFIFVNLIIAELFWRRRDVLLSQSVVGLAFFLSLFFCVSLLRVIYLTAVSFSITLLGKIFLAASLAFLLSWRISPLVRRINIWLGVVDDPETHNHPAVLHTKPIPRGGSLAFLLGFLPISFLFLPWTKKLIGIYIGTILLTLVGLLDDRFDLNPYLRLALQCVAALVVVGAGIGIAFFRIPWLGFVHLDVVDIPFYLWGEHHILLLADLFAFLWLIWTMNMLSWSNGVDGQFSGITSITFFVLAALSLRFVSYEPQQVYTAMLAAIAGGASLGLLPLTWHPAKMFWGFGATVCGLLIAALSILSGAKVATAALVLLVPLLDAFVAILRRLLRGQSPVWGDRGHLHHHLLQKGLGHRGVAVVYWLLTALCGGLALYTAGKSKAITLLSMGLVVGFVLVFLNLRTRLWATLFDLDHENDETSSDKD